MFELFILGAGAYLVHKVYKSIKPYTKSKKKKPNRWYQPTRKTMSSAEIRQRVEKERMKMENTYPVRTLHKEKKYLIRKGLECPGVYIFTNLNNNRKYVGQSVNILNRVETHVRGRGSKDMYKDLAKGHEFIVQFITLESSKHYDLNSLERYYIRKMNAYSRGYNKTRGNQ